MVDDEAPARDELALLLSRDPRIGRVERSDTGERALALIEQHAFDVVFLDIRMPGMTGLDLAAALGSGLRRPVIVFVTEHEDHAVSALGLDSADYLLKPVGTQRLTEAIRRISELSPLPTAPPDDEEIAVELAGVTRFVNRSDIRFVEAHGDYARLVTATASHLVRVPLATLEERWRDAGFVRIHRRHLVSLRHVEEVRIEAGQASVRLAGRDLAVSRRHHRDLRELLARRIGRSMP